MSQLTIHLLLLVSLACAFGALIWLWRRDAAVIANLRVAARTDPLTGALNRRGFIEEFQIELDRSSRGDQPVSLMIGDLDGFKQVNDRLGHMGGDMALERASGLLARWKRSTDRLARIGGEEFAMILPEADGEQGIMVAERLRAKLEEGFEPLPVDLTISVGVAAFPEDGATLEELLHAADLAMYSAKRSGKNRCVLYDPKLGKMGATPGRGSGEDSGGIEAAVAELVSQSQA